MRRELASSQAITNTLSSVSMHACERYVQRIIGIPCSEKSLSFTQGLMLSRASLDILNKHHPTAINMKQGKFYCQDDDCIMVMEDNKIVTVNNIRRDKEEKLSKEALSEIHETKELHKSSKRKYNANGSKKRKKYDRYDKRYD